MLNNRRHFRLKHHMDVDWEVSGQADAGHGSVLNLSLSGAFLQTDKVFKPTDHCVISLKAQDTANAPFIEKQGKLMWFRRIQTPHERYQCGIQFLNSEGDAAYAQWIENQIKQLSETSNMNILSNLAV